MVKSKSIKVITLTVNPAIDVHIRLDELLSGFDNLGRIERRDLGGKGVNVSRALISLGLDSLCFVVAGEENGINFLEGLREQGLKVDYCLVNGAVRENINMHTRNGDTVVATEGPLLGKEDIELLSLKLLPHIQEHTILVFSGRIAEGSDKEGIIDMLLRAQEKGAALILDSRSLTAGDVSKLSPLMIKPNLEEAEHILGHKIDNPISAAGELATLGADYVILTLGKEGLVLSDGKKEVFCPSVEVEVNSTVGAGDSTVASFIYSQINGFSFAETAMHAVATSAAACLTKGTLPPWACEINRLFEQIKSTSQT